MDMVWEYCVLCRMLNSLRVNENKLGIYGKDISCSRFGWGCFWLWFFIGEGGLSNEVI